MSVFAFLNHVLNFAAPALFVALVSTLLVRFAMRPRSGTMGFWRQAGITFVLGLLVLAGGLLITGHDGQMATYAALVLVCGTGQWWLAGGFKR